MQSPDVIQVQKRMLISLASIGKRVGIKEGDYLSVEIKDGGIFLRPVDWHDKRQSYFWSKSWQERLNQSQNAIGTGRFQSYENIEAVFEGLER